MITARTRKLWRWMAWTPTSVRGIILNRLVGGLVIFGAVLILAAARDDFTRVLWYGGLFSAGQLLIGVPLDLRRRGRTWGDAAPGDSHEPGLWSNNRKLDGRA